MINMCDFINAYNQLITNFSNVRSMYAIVGIKTCMEANKLVDEESHEISIDTHGIRDGPRLGRLRLLNKVCPCLELFFRKFSMKLLHFFSVYKLS